MEEDEDAARLKILEMELQVEKLKLAKSVREKAAKSAAAAKTAHDVAEAAKTAQDNRRQAAKVEAEEKAARAEAERTEKAQRDKALQDEAELLRQTALESTKTKHELPLGGVSEERTTKSGGWDQVHAMKNTTARRENDACNDAKRQKQDQDNKVWAIEKREIEKE